MYGATLRSYRTEFLCGRYCVTVPVDYRFFLPAFLVPLGVPFEAGFAAAFAEEADFFLLDLPLAAVGVAGPPFEARVRPVVPKAVSQFCEYFSFDPVRKMVMEDS